MNVSAVSAVRSAYVHVPFCRHRCGYCDFTVVADRLELEQSYLQAIEIELRGLGQPQVVDTLFVGGGTPTEMTGEGLSRLLLLMQEWFPLLPDGEFTMEANPDRLDLERLELLRGYHVNRLSLGVQSFSNAKLARLDRQHSAEEVERALQLARPMFPRLSLDLIFAAPEEMLDDWQADVETAIDWQTDHISTYGLTFEKGTAFWADLQQKRVVEVDESLQGEMYELAISRLTTAGFEHYEVSNFAQPDCRCRHNEVYWTGGSYFAVGPGASRYVDGVRETNHRSTTAYLNRVLAAKSPVAESERLDPETRARERLVFGLRRLEGVAREPFADETGFTIESLAGDVLARLIDQGFLEMASHLRLTRKGLLVSDSLWPQLL